VPPKVCWLASIAGQLIPIFVIIQTIALIVLVILKKESFIIPFLILIIGWSFVAKSFSLNANNLPTITSIRILSFNTKLFRKPKTYSEFSTDLIKWVSNDSSDIKCLQEYSTNSKWPLLDVTSQINKKGYSGYIFRAMVTDSDHSPGMAIFSKFDLLDSGIVFQDKNTLNAAIYVDLNIGGKTTRVYNVHLASMNIDLNETGGFGNILLLLKRLKYGSIKRISQIDTLIKHTKSSPYPYIICGDFNETPYSYAYQQLSSQFLNAFEEAGNGFGFTFNEVPYLLRIDHQFYRSDIQAVGYHVNRTIKISDHFPTYGYYLLPK